MLDIFNTKYSAIQIVKAWNTSVYMSFPEIHSLERRICWIAN